MADNKWYGVDGDRVIGPFHLLVHAKQGLSIPSDVHNDEVVVKNGLYRYGAKFIGKRAELVRRNMMVSQKEPFATHVAVVMGRLMPSGRIETLYTGDWLALEPTLQS